MHWIKISAAGYHAALSPENEAVALPSEDAMRSRVYFVFETATGQIVGAPLALSSLPHFQNEWESQADSSADTGEPVVVELYEDLVPSAAREFRLRCSGGGAGRLGTICYEGTAVDGLCASPIPSAAPALSPSSSTDSFPRLAGAPAAGLTAALRRGGYGQRRRR